VWTGFVWLRIGARGGFCEQGNEPSGFMKFLESSINKISVNGCGCSSCKSFHSFEFCLTMLSVAENM
jgi:hypothetical protein